MVRSSFDIDAMERISELLCEHIVRTASQCGHEIHPSASKHMPRCPDCILLLGRARLDAARKELVDKGGLTPADYKRDGRWNRAKLKYLVAEERLDRVRRQDQWRWEREREWDRAHRGRSRQCIPTAANSQGLVRCLICFAIMASNPEVEYNMGTVTDLAWWERPGALAVAHGHSIKVPRAQRIQKQVRTNTVVASPALCQLVQIRRAYTRSMEADKEAYAVRSKVETAFRRKVKLGELHIDADFWETPISGLVSLQMFQHSQDIKRMSAFRSRWKKPQEKLPTSPLSQSEQSDELDLDETWLISMREKEEMLRLERAAARVGQEVGYLYFVGRINGMVEWREDLLRSNVWLVFRSYHSEYADFMD